MRLTKPLPRLLQKQIGDNVQLHGDGSQRTYIVSEIRCDGYYVLSINGDWKVIASSYHRVIK